MENFQFCVGTNILFGKNQILNLSDVLGKYGKKVLLTYGGGSIKRTGLYDKVKELLSGFEVYELDGIEPNPKLASVYAGEKLCKGNGIDVVLAVGGGSVIDCSKAIAAAACYEGDAWDLITFAAPIEKALPLCTVLTIVATGSEMNSGAVISNPQTNEKIGFMSSHLIPKASILDPIYTFTVPKNQTAAGTADVLSHLLEQYFVSESTFMTDLLVESVIKTVIKYAPVAIAEPENYEAQAQLMWASSIGDNGTLSNGNRLCAFSCHGIEHELSAYYDITHGVGLAIVTPRWMRYVLSKNTVDRFAHYGTAVWGIEPSQDKYETANQAIDATENFLKSLGIPMRLTELGIDDKNFEAMAEHAVPSGALAYGYVPLDKNDVVNILKMCV